MKKLLIILLAVLMLFGCSSQPKEDEIIVLEIAMFEGGFGSEWVETVVENYKEINPNVTIDLQASPDIHQQLQPRFLSDDVPDLINPGPNFDILGVVDNGSILGLNDVLQENAYDSSTPWIDTFEKSQFDIMKDDTYYGIPIVSATGYIWWYNERLFNDSGYTVPTTLDELYSLNEKALEDGLSLFAVPGKAPAYAFYGVYLPLVQRNGGTQVIEDAYKFKEDAWTHEAFLEAANEIEKMREEGVFSEGSASFSHIEAQTQFFQDKSLFATAGTWLEGEMQDIIPEDFVLKSLNFPVINSENEDSDAVSISSGWGGAWYIPKDAKHSKEAIEFLKYLSSQEQVSLMVESRGLGSVVIGTNDAIKSESLKSVNEMMAKSDHSFYPTAINDINPEFTNNIVNKFQSLMLGEISAQEFVDYMSTKSIELAE